MSQILRLYVHDLRRVLREPRSFRLLVLALALTSAATILAWPNETHHTRISSVQTVAVFAFTELVLLLLLAPLLASSIFTAERARNTSVLLETSLLSPGEFALSRLASIATTLTIAFSATAPIFAALHLLGGVAIEQILRMVAILLAAGISSAAIAVRAAFNTPAKSSLFGRVLLAVLGWQFGVPLLVWLGLLIPGVVINELGSAFGPSFVLDQSYRILLGFNSFAALGLTLDQPGVAATFGYLAFATFIVM
ncbi:MAG TPA: hypothetical protein VK116_00420, partial [Planctomycetota bacterium]|nr:hypothetical protein [Planctomycetota bacterium]